MALKGWVWEDSGLEGNGIDRVICLMGGMLDKEMRMDGDILRREGDTRHQRTFRELN